MTPFLLSAANPALCLWKPPGLPVFPPHAAPAEASLLGWWRDQPEFPTDTFPRGFEGGLAHRLDTATSGIVLAARDAAHLERLRELFTSRSLRKFYLFRTVSGPGSDIQTETPIGHHPKSDRRMVVADRAWRRCRGRWYDAWTRFHWLGADPGLPGAHLWQAEIRTGVMHQVRVHALHVGLPLCGDPLYGGASDPAAHPFLLHHVLVVFPDGTQTPLAPLPAVPVDPLAPAQRSLIPAPDVLV